MVIKIVIISVLPSHNEYRIKPKSKIKMNNSYTPKEYKNVSVLNKQPQAVNKTTELTFKIQSKKKKKTCISNVGKL